MDSLLEEMRELERGIGAPGPAPVQSPAIAELAAQEDVSCWADQYLEAGKHFQVGQFLVADMCMCACNKLSCF